MKEILYVRIVISYKSLIIKNFNVCTHDVYKGRICIKVYLIMLYKFT